MDSLKSKWNYSYNFNGLVFNKVCFLYDKEYSEVLVFFTDNISKYTIFLFLVVAFIHSALEI